MNTSRSKLARPPAVRPVRRRGRVLAGLVAGAALVVAAAPVAAQERTSYLGPEEGETLTSWTERWLDGPVQYIATEEEIALYGSLASTNQRLQFIRLFWERRDPTYRGPENEFLEEFVRRVEYADEHFSEGQLAAGGLPGWQTAFGRVVLVLGPPDRTRRELGFPTAVSQRPVILWGYDRRLPSPWPNNEMLMFVFQRGRWRLAPPSTLTDPASAETAARELERISSFAEIPNDFLRVTQELIDESLLQTVNYNNVVEAIEAEVAFPDAEIPFAWEASFAPGEGGQTMVTLTLTWRMESLVFHVVDGNYETEMVVYALLSHENGEPVAETSERVDVTVPAADLAARNDELIERTLTLTAAPGTYRLRLSLDDYLLGYRSVYAEDLVVPER
jgi:GWxTD domain-containing protein